MQELSTSDLHDVSRAVNDKGNRVVWIDQLRAIGMLIVILGHVALDKNAIKYIYSFHMPLFFLISGLTQKPARYGSFKLFISYKIKKLLLPYFLLNIIMIPLWFLNFKVLSHSNVSLEKLLIGIIYSNSDKYTAPSNATWFLTTLFLVQVLFYFCEKFSKGDIKKFALIAMIMGLVGYMESANSLNYSGIWHIQIVPTAFVFYFLGFAIIQYLPDIMKVINKKRNYFILLILMAAIGYYFSTKNKRISFSGNNLGSIIYFYISAVCTSASFILLLIKVPKIGVLTYIGKNTILYLGLHIPIIRLFEKLFPTIMSQPIYAALFAVLLFFALIPICMFFNKFLPFVSGKYKIKKDL